VSGPSRVAIVGAGLIGGSIGLALRRAGTYVLGFDHQRARAERAEAMGVLDGIAATIADAARDSDLLVVAVPVGRVPDIAIEALDAGSPLVTDVGSVKDIVVAAVEAARPSLAHRFVGGHPMAGSEQEGLDGASPDLFVGATWVLTPTAHTDPSAFATVRALVAELGAETIAVAPALHDALVAVVSHVPQLAASTLMDLAARGGEEHGVLLRLAAGGFRDMTRVASGNPSIWPDICLANREAIVDTLDEYVGALTRVRDLVRSEDRDGLLDLLHRARVARRNLPVGLPVDEALVELRVPVPDRPGVIAQVTTLATTLGVNIADLEIAHSLEGRRGVLVLVVAAGGADAFEAALVGQGYHVARTPVE
jgi:prephenate dehydrogenase